MQSDRKNEQTIEIDILPGMIDSHFHSTVMIRKGINSRELFDRYFELGFTAGIDIGTKAGDTANRAWIRESHPDILLASGLYPAESELKDTESLLTRLKDDISRFEVSAIGEIGLDYHWNYATQKEQQELFALQIDMANEYGLPIIVHNREADADVLKLLTDHPVHRGGIMHCFSSDYSYAKKFVDAGFYISFAGNVTYKNNNEIKEAAMLVPSDRILVETDSPYLSPRKVRGRPNHPGHIGFIYREIAELRAIYLQTCIETVGRNFRSLFSLH